MRKLAEYSAVAVLFIYSCKHYGHHKQNKQNIGRKLEKYISHMRGEGGMFDNGNVNWCMLGGHFCVEPGIFASNWAFLCRTRLFAVIPGFLCRTSVITTIILHYIRISRYYVNGISQHKKLCIKRLLERNVWKILVAVYINKYRSKKNR